ncbi:MAG: hypothetical protein AAF514_08925 [Verrucomicrobiota bacterium]
MMQCTVDPPRVVELPAAPLLESDPFQHDCLFVGTMVSVETKQLDGWEVEATYQFRVTDVVGSNPGYEVGTIFQSKADRMIVAGERYVICINRKGGGEDEVIDRTFPLLIDEKLEEVLEIMEKKGIDPAAYTDEERARTFDFRQFQIVE